MTPAIKGFLLAVIAALLLPACKKEQAAPAEVTKPATERPVLVAKQVDPHGKQQLEAVDPKIANDVNRALDELVTAKPETASAQDLAATKDPGRLLGRWQIEHTIYSTNGKASPPSPPLAPTRWVFEKDGRLSIQGGMKIDLRYVYTGDRLIVTGLGPKQNYQVVKLTDKRLEVKSRIQAGTTLIENTTVLKRP